MAYITEDEGIVWALPYSSANRAAQFQGSQASGFVEALWLLSSKGSLCRATKSVTSSRRWRRCHKQASFVRYFLVPLHSAICISNLDNLNFFQWLSMILRRQGQLTSGDGRSSGKIPLASPRPSVDPSAIIKIQPPRKSTALSPVNSGSSDKAAASNVAVKSLKMGKSGYVGMTPTLTPRRVGQDVDPKILQMAAHAASLRPSTTRSEISASDVGFSVLRGTVSCRGDSTRNETPDEHHHQKATQPPLPPHVLPPAHAHRKPNVRDRKDEGV